MQKKNNNLQPSTFNLHLSNGFTLLETIVAVFIITVAIAGIFGLISRITAATNRSSSRLIAAYLAQEGIEIVRNIRDSNWLDPAASWNDNLVCPGGCEADYASQTLTDSYDGDFLKINGGFYNYSAGSDTRFKRKITVIQSGDTLEVSSEVIWDDHQATARENLYKWR